MAFLKNIKLFNGISKILLILGVYAITNINVNDAHIYADAHSLSKRSKLSINDLLFEESCDEFIYVQSQAVIIKHDIVVSKNISNTNEYEYDNYNDIEYDIEFTGSITIKYKTLPYCIYECNLFILTHHKYRYIEFYIKKKYNVGWGIEGNCSNKGCIFNGEVCHADLIHDEL
jgi:hypothetical protein